jgi:hypothetical protein
MPKSRSRPSRRLRSTRTAPAAHRDTVDVADTLAHSPFSITGGVQNVSHVFIKAFVTQCLTSHCYACRLTASAGEADAALYFLQTIDAAHCPNSSSLTFKEEATPGFFIRAGPVKKKVGRFR